MMSGIYKIEHVASGKMYVGGTVSFEKRWERHRSELSRGVHQSAALQNAWGGDGAEAFVFSILEFVDERERITEREQFWIDHLRACDGGFNTIRTAVANRKRAGHPTSEETKAKLKAALKGRPKKAETRAKITARTRARNYAGGCKLTAAVAEAFRLGRGNKSPEVIAKRVATRSHNKALKMLAASQIAEALLQ